MIKTKLRNKCTFLTLFSLSLILFFISPAISKEVKKAKPAAKPLARVTIMKVEPSPAAIKGISENSTLEAMKQVILYPRVSGRLTKTFVKQGDSIKTGDPLAELDHRDVDAQISQARAQIAVARAQVAQARAELENAKRERDRYRRLLKEGFSTQQQLDSKETSYSTRKAAVDLSIAQVRQYQANLDRLKVDLSEYTIRASIDGIVLNDYSRTPGEMMTPQTAVIEIANVKYLKAVIKAPEAHAEIIKKGMTAYITVAGKSKKFKGEVYRVRPFVDISTRTTQVEVAVDAQTTTGTLKPGMFARVLIVEKTLKNAIMMPDTSVLQKSGKDYVMIYSEGTAHKRPVKTGLRVNDKIEITDGITAGEMVIVSGGKNIADGDKVEAREAKKL